VVERIAPAAGNFPVLTKTNYYDWAALMRVMLQAQGLWTAVSDSTDDFTEDRMALEVISKAIPPEHMGTVASKAAWDMLRLRNIRVDRIRKAKAGTLKREFDALKFREGESVDDFGSCLSRITNELAVLGEEFTEEEIVRKFLQALPAKFEQIAQSIETLLNLSEVTVDELIGRLKATEERFTKTAGNTVQV
jgi:hypothetical protein